MKDEVAWHPIDGETCSHCRTYVATEWKSSRGHHVRYMGSGMYRGYAPDGIRVLEDYFYDNHNEAFADCVKLSGERASKESKGP